MLENVRLKQYEPWYRDHMQCQRQKRIYMLNNNVPEDYWKWLNLLSLKWERLHSVKQSEFLLVNIMEEKGPTIGQWKIRSYGELAKLIMEFGKKPYQVEYYKMGPGPEWSQ